MIDGLLGLQSDDAHKRARQILQERFGDPYKINQAYNERLKSWPVCSKASELQEFNDFLATVKETMKTVKHLKDFDTFSAIQDLVVRLPPYCSKKWLQSAKAVELGKGKYDFNDLVDFVQKAAKDATHPVFSHEVLLSKRKELLKDKKQEDKNSYHKRKFGSFNTSKYNESSSHSDKNTNELMRPARRKPHKLENCDIFLKTSESKNGNKKENEESSKEKPKVANRVVVCHSNDCNEVITSSLILPVWICHKDNPEKKIMTYAVLDDQSDTCFVTDSVCDQLEIEGPETVIELGTMHVVEDIRTQKIRGLIVSSEDKSVDVPLPKAYSRGNIPARRDQIPRVEMAINWSHLSQIANEITEYRDDLGIGLLIVNNCVEAIRPRDVIPGKPQDPYSIRTVFEKTQVNEVLNPHEVLKMFEHDFSERKKEKPMSLEDRKFLNITKREIQVTDDGQYELPLLFRNDKVELPSNRKLAESRQVDFPWWGSKLKFFTSKNYVIKWYGRNKRIVLVKDNKEQSLVEKFKTLATLIEGEFKGHSDEQHAEAEDTFGMDKTGENIPTKKTSIPTHATEYREDVDNSEIEMKSTKYGCDSGKIINSQCHCSELAVQFKRIEGDLKLLKNRIEVREADETALVCRTDHSKRKELSKNLTTAIRIIQEDNSLRSNVNNTEDDQGGNQWVELNKKKKKRKRDQTQKLQEIPTITTHENCPLETTCADESNATVQKNVIISSRQGRKDGYPNTQGNHQNPVK
ncbi:Hypothetical predicted protein, partial [Paramuricea clavata]